MSQAKILYEKANKKLESFKALNAQLEEEVSNLNQSRTLENCKRMRSQMSLELKDHELDQENESKCNMNNALQLKLLVMQSNLEAVDEDSKEDGDRVIEQNYSHH